MSRQFYDVPVKAIEKTTEDCVILSFDIEDEWKPLFRYHQGQYLTLKVKLNGEEIRRSYSLCSSPLDNEWKVAVKRVEGGRFSCFANDRLQVGDRVAILPPDGRFFVPLDPAAAKRYVAFAAGSGITPVFSIIKTHLIEEPQSVFTLFYVNRHASSIMLKEELEALKNRFIDRLEIFYFLTREERNIPVFNGRLDVEKLNFIFEKLLSVAEVDDYFICGPQPMIFLIRDYLLEKGVDKKKIHFELFNTSGIAVRKRVPSAKNGKHSAVTIFEGGKSFSFTIPLASDTILDAGLKRSADLPYACKGGVCCSCRARLVEGKVDMPVNYALEEEELEAGYILTCQSVPVSEKVVVDFDG